MNDEKNNKKNPLFHPVVIVASVVLCFPATLFLVWFKPDWEKKTKWIWTGCFAAFWGFIMIVGMIADHQTTERLKQAEVLWTQGDQEASADIYLEYLNTHRLDTIDKMFIDEDMESDRRKLQRLEKAYSRVIEYYANAGYRDKARQFYGQCQEDDLTPMITDEIKSKFLTQ